jgi:sugar/nucleoside kinase (ribokinase family)
MSISESDMKLDFLGVGGLSYDLLLRVDCLPTSDGKVPASLIGRLPGGFIANSTCAAARLGLDSGYIGWVGDDAEGMMLGGEFERLGIDATGLTVVPGQATPFTVVMVTDAGERAIVVPSSAVYEQPLGESQIAFAGRARIVLTYPRDVAWCKTLANRVHDAGGIFALDVEDTSPLTGDTLRKVLVHTDVVFVTESSLPLTDETSLEEIAGPQWIVMTAGKRGAYGFDGSLHQLVYQPAYPVKTVDTTGAGDCFHAALLTAWLRGATLAEALRVASAAAALKVQHQGARNGLPTLAEVEGFLHAMAGGG